MSLPKLTLAESKESHLALSNTQRARVVAQVAQRVAVLAKAGVSGKPCPPSAVPAARCAGASCRRWKPVQSVKPFLFLSRLWRGSPGSHSLTSQRNFWDVPRPTGHLSGRQMRPSQPGVCGPPRSPGPGKEWHLGRKSPGPGRRLPPLPTLLCLQRPLLLSAAL